MRREGVTDVLRQLREDQESRFLQLRRIGRDALEHERQQLRPAVIGQDPGGELRNGVAQLLGDRLRLLPLQRRQQNRFERGLSGNVEARPEVGVVARELLAEEDGGHGARLKVGGELEEVGELEGERVGIGLLAEVEERLGLGTELVGGGHEVRDQGLEGTRVGAEYDGELRLLQLSRLGIHYYYFLFVCLVCVFGERVRVFGCTRTPLYIL